VRTVALKDLARFANGRAFKPSDWGDMGLPIVRIQNLNDRSAPFSRYDGQVAEDQTIVAGDLLLSWSASLDAYIWDGERAVLNQHIFKVIERHGIIDRTYLFFALRDAMTRIRAQVHGATMQHVTKPLLEAIRVPLPSIDLQLRASEDLQIQLRAAASLSLSASTATECASAWRRSAYDRTFIAITPLAAAGVTNEAPNGWRWHRLTDIARLESGHTPSRSRPDWWTGDVPWIQLADIRAVDGQVIHATSETTNAEGIAHSAARILPAGTVVMSRTASVGFVARMGRPMATSQDFVNWVCGPDLDPEFLMHLLIRSRDYVRSLSAGAIHKTVYYPTVKDFHVCIPPIAEQRRIAADLRERLATIDAMTRAIEVQREAIDALPAALLRRTFAEIEAA
jgi:type I restriction enzyme, S subunit